MKAGEFLKSPGKKSIGTDLTFKSLKNEKRILLLKFLIICVLTNIITFKIIYTKEEVSIKKSIDKKYTFIEIPLRIMAPITKGETQISIYNNQLKIIKKAFLIGEKVNDSTGRTSYIIRLLKSDLMHIKNHPPHSLEAWPYHKEDLSISKKRVRHYEIIF